jgi:hypothetical protein
MARKPNAPQKNSPLRPVSVSNQLKRQSIEAKRSWIDQILAFSHWWWVADADE